MKAGHKINEFMYIDESEYGMELGFGSLKNGLCNLSQPGIVLHILHTFVMVKAIKNMNIKVK